MLGIKSAKIACGKYLFSSFIRRDELRIVETYTALVPQQNPRPPDIHFETMLTLKVELCLPQFDLLTDNNLPLCGCMQPVQEHQTIYLGNLIPITDESYVSRGNSDISDIPQRRGTIPEEEAGRIRVGLVQSGGGERTEPCRKRRDTVKQRREEYRECREELSCASLLRTIVPHELQAIAV